MASFAGLNKIEYSVQCMKNYRQAEIKKDKQEERLTRHSPLDRKNYSSNPTFQHRLLEYEGLAKRAKEQLKQFENKRKVSPNDPKQTTSNEQRTNEKPKHPIEPRPNPHQKTLQHTYSHKFLRKQQEESKAPRKDEKLRLNHYQLPKQEKLSADIKIESPRKKHYIDSNQYKKLHEKLDLIEHKITDMKKNLQKKKEQKQRTLQTKQKQEKESSDHQRKHGLKDIVTKVPEHHELHTFNSNPYSPRHNIYYVSELVRAYKDQQSLAREHLVTSLNILKILEKSKRLGEEEIKKIMMTLPKKKGYQDKKTIIFDLDETLVHCNDTLNPPYDVKLPIKFPTGEIIEAGINIRPYSKDLLKNLSKFFEIILFTASHSCYANVVIDYLDPNRQWVQHRLYREHCYLSPEGMYIKDLRVINRDPKNMVLVDNAAYSYAFQLENGIPIFPYYHGQIDFELKVLEDYLMKFVFAKDVRQINESTFKLSQYKHYYGRPEKLVQQLYIQ